MPFLVHWLILKCVGPSGRGNRPAGAWFDELSPELVAAIANKNGKPTMILWLFKMMSDAVKPFSEG